MKEMRLRSPFWSLFVVALLVVALSFFCSEAQAWRGGGRGFHGGGGFSGGSFRGGGGYATGPRGGAVAEGPRGGRYAQTPRGGQAYRSPYGGAAARGPGGGTAYRPGYPAGGAYNRNVNVSRNWQSYYGPRYGGVAAGAAAGLAVGAVVGSLSAAAQPLVVNNQTYYYDGTNYYQPCYQGTDVNYCVVPDPNQ
jgi:hypothetical protein